MKKILLISYYFPPCGGAAVQRWLRLAKQLILRGYALTVVTPQKGDFPLYDFSLQQEIPPAVKVLRTRSISITKLWSSLFPRGQHIPYGSLQTARQDSLLRKALIWIRLNLIFPDIRIFWNPFAFHIALKELKTHKYDLLITSGPPHSTHLIGYLLRHRIKWITDFRDPWSKIHYYDLNPPLKLSRMIHQRLEKLVISSAIQNLIISQNIAEQLPAGCKTVLYNGYDADDFEGLSYQATDKFRIKYIGQLTAGQEIIPLLKHLAGLKLPQVSIELVGTKLTDECDLLIRNLEQECNISLKPFLPHRQALHEMVNSELLILIINQYQGSSGMLTTKLFEYLASQCPILCVGDSQGEAASLIRERGAGLVVDTSTDPAIQDYIHKVHQNWSDGQAFRTGADISIYSSQIQINRLIEIIQTSS